MAQNGFWGNTNPLTIYDASVLLAQIHEYFAIDPESEAYSLLHRLFLETEGSPVFALLEKEFLD